MKINKIIIASIFIMAVLLLVSSTSFKLSPASVVTAVSTVNYQSNTGEVRDGYLYGSKMTFHATITEDPLEILYPFAGKEQTWGTYKIIPQNNMFIKISSSPRAEYSIKQYSQSYYKPAFGQVYQTQDLESVSKKTYTPMHIEIYADSKPLPDTLVLSKDLPDPCPNCEGISTSGQQLYHLGNNINLQRASISQTGSSATLPDSYFVVATAPEFKDFENTKLNPYKSGQTYIFSHTSYDSGIKYFYDNWGSRTLVWLNSPHLALWTGYDKYSTLGLGTCSGVSGLSFSNKGYCKLNGWDGLYSKQQVTLPETNIRYEYATQKLVSEPIQYAADVVLEIPSEYIKSFAILRGVGEPEVTYSVSSDIMQGDRLYLNVDVKNIGDSDGFGIVPTSMSGKLLFSPPSYTSQYIQSNTKKSFKFGITVAGKETSETTAYEDINLKVQAEHGQKPVNNNFNMKITYKATSETGNQPGATVKPGDSDTMNDNAGGKVTILKWFENPWFFIGIIITILSAVYYLSTKKR